MSLVTLPRQILVDVNGNPRVGAKANFYQAGTTTPISVYTTNAYSVAHANPVVSVSSGFFPAIYVNPAVNATYKIVVTDSSDVAIWTEDNIPALAMTQSEIGQTLYPRTAAEISASITPTAYYYEPLDIRRYGAVNGGVTDCTTAIQAAVDVAEAGNNDTVTIPCGIWRVNGTVTINQGVMLVAPGSGGTTEPYGCVLIHYSNSNMLVWDGNGATAAGTGGGLKNVLCLKANTYSGGDAIKLLATSDNFRPGEFVMENLLVFGTGTGLWARGVHVDGTACNTAGSKGVRTVVMHKVRVADCTTNNQYVYINQGVHVSATHLQIDVGDGTGTCGMTVEGDSDNVMLSNLIINGNLIIGGSSAMNVCLNGRVSVLDVNNANVLGTAAIQSTGITNAAKNFKITSNVADAFAARLNTTVSNLTGDNTTADVVYDTELFDKNATFNPATGVYTCKIAGTYQVDASVCYTDLGSGHTRQDTSIVHRDSGGSTVETITDVSNPYAASAGGNFVSKLSAVLDLSEGDTVRVQANASGSTKTVDILGSSTAYTRFSVKAVA